MQLQAQAFVLNLLCFASLVLCNTEIVNFDVTEVDGVETLSFLTADWPVLHSGRNEREWTLDPAPFGSSWETVCENEHIRGKTNRPNLPTTTACHHELWTVLDTSAEEWQKYSKFTLRLSYPASFPADFKLDILPPTAVASHFGFSPSQDTSPSPPKTRQHYARIRIIDTGVLTPRPKHSLPVPPFVPQQDPSGYPKPVPFILVLEPLYFGVLPPTVVPVLVYISLAVVVSLFVTPKIIQFFNELAAKAREEFAQKPVKSE